MDITNIIIRPKNSSEICKLNFKDPGAKEPYNVKDIIGLDADEIISQLYGSSRDSKVKFFNLSLRKREIVIQMELNPRFYRNETYGSLRDNIFRMIASARTGLIQVRFNNGDNVVAAIEGFVQKVESPTFNKTQEIHLTISCNDPMLKSLRRTEVDVSGLDPALTVITDDVSNAPHGFKFAIRVLENVSWFAIADPYDQTWDFQMLPAGTTFMKDDIIYFSSEYNDKQIYLTREASPIYLANIVVSGSIWPLLFPGKNSFVLANPESYAWNSISYFETYWGV